MALVLATSAGGVGRHVAAVARGLAARGHRVDVFGPASTGERFDFSGGRTDFHRLEIASGLHPVVALRAAWRLRGLIRDVDVVHAHGLRAAVVTALSRLHVVRRRRPVFVVTLHNAMLGNKFRQRVLEFVMRQAVRGFDVVLAVSDDLADSVRAVKPFVERALISAVLREPSRDRAAVRQSLELAADTTLVLAIGRLHSQKGFDVLVNAARLLQREVPRAVVLIAGDGPQRQNLQRQIADAGVGVRLLGDRSDVADLVHAADAIVMPSRWEGWPMAAAEVIGAGRPLVATRVGGIPELVGDAALLIEPDDPNSLAEALARVLTDEGLAADLMAAARRRASGLPTDGDVVNQLVSCYQERPRR